MTLFSPHSISSPVLSYIHNFKANQKCLSFLMLEKNFKDIFDRSGIVLRILVDLFHFETNIRFLHSASSVDFTWFHPECE